MKHNSNSRKRRPLRARVIRAFALTLLFGMGGAAHGGSHSAESNITVVDTLLEKAKITLQPESQIVEFGDSAEFVVGASGTQPLEYQWYKDGQQIAGAIETIYRIVSVSQGDLGIYSVWAQNKLGRAYSQTVELSLAQLHTLTVASRDPNSGVTVTLSPADHNGQSNGTTQFTRVYLNGTEVTLSAKQSVGANKFKQWLKNGEPAVTDPTVTVTMDYDRTLRAVYEPGPVGDPTLKLLISRVLLNQDQITIQAVGKPRFPLETVELELSYDLIHWETQDLQLPINLPLSFPLAQDMQFMRVKRIKD